MERGMEQKQGVNFGLLALDGVGAILFAIGAVGKFGSGSLLPEAWQFPGHNMVLITVGIALMLPYMLNVLATARRKKEAQSRTPNGPRRQ